MNKHQDRVAWLAFGVFVAGMGVVAFVAIVASFYYSAPHP
jgi:hypothetical protein